LGVRYATGNGIATDDAQAARWIEKAATQGHVGAQFDLGLMYADGNGVPQDSKIAVDWLRKAADQGDARAMSNLGLMYANWERRADGRGGRSRLVSQGGAEERGHGAVHAGPDVCERHRHRRNPATAVGWFEKAAAQGHILAQYNLGLAYARGSGVPPDAVKAGQWFRAAADQGDAQSQFMLGTMYANGAGVAR
jgi:TPR repeat protein